MSLAIKMSESTQSKPSLFQEFRQDFALVWPRIPDKGLFLGLLALWLLIFQFIGNSTFGYVDSPSLFVWLSQCYNHANSDDSHGNLIPFIVLGLLWWKRNDFFGLEPRVWWPGLGILAVSMILHILGYSIQQQRVSAVALFLGGFSLIALVWGWKVARTCLFPYFLFAFSIPTSAVLEPLTIPLRSISTDISVVICRHFLGIPVIQEGVQLIDPKGGYHYEVAAACSGIRSLITLTAVTTVYGFLTLPGIWRRGIMVLSALPLALLGNVLRLVTIIVAAQTFGQAAGDFVHEWFGFVSFAIALGGMALLGKWLRPRESQAGHPPTPPLERSASDAALTPQN